ncbi:MAG: HDOD domain-containing protein [Pseudomonadota bacterium]
MEVFVARQPIFDSSKNVIAYELLFRSSLDNFYDVSLDGDKSTSKVITCSLLIIGLDTLTKGKKAYINFTKNLLLRGAPFMIPKELIAVEILETVAPDSVVVKACRELKKAGYMLVLDDFVFAEQYRPLIELADVIKVDFLSPDVENRKRVIRNCDNKKIKFLAEKVETVDVFQEALDLGYTYFQGYFFSKPVIIRGRDIPGSKVNYLRVLHEVNSPGIEFEKLEEIIKRDVSLSYKLLRFINSAFFKFSIKVESIKHALFLLGLKEIKKWASVLALSGMGFDKPQELLMVSLIRARFCETLAEKIGQQSRTSDFFITGLFSVIDALIDRPMQEILVDLPIADDIKQALLGEDNNLHDVFFLAVSYEKGNWEQTHTCARKLRINEAELPDIFFNSVSWANVAL